ncbi:hypothetical protein [Arabiibacter massiliensis]|uniref:hypothetical protein n=1 Tax=Arabiibacter massiliensis TaxID=1870985 RepID=UPI0009BB2A25|nr:hypothetical protein [Arabiibacter massiliensis]
MQSIDTGIANYLSTLGVDEAKKLRIAQNNQKFKEAVQNAWPDNPSAAVFLLAHTNSLYVKKDEAPRTGPGKDEDRYVMGVYLDDATARSELSARRELLKFLLSKRGIHVDDIVIHPALRGVKENHLFPELIEQANDLLGVDAAARRDVRVTPAMRDEEAWREDQADLLEILKRAFCLTFPELDQAEAVLEKIEGAALVEAEFHEEARRGGRRHWCRLYVAAEDVPGMEAIVASFGETLRCKAKPLGLRIAQIIVSESPESMRGRRAFPPVGRPEPFADTGLQELRAESIRAAAEVRAKLRGQD